MKGLLRIRLVLKKRHKGTRISPIWFNFKCVALPVRVVMRLIRYNFMFTEKASEQTEIRKVKMTLEHLYGMFKMLLDD